MIEKILERLKEERNEVVVYDDDDYFVGMALGFTIAKDIVQEVAEEYGWISVDDYLPAHDEIVLVYYECQHIDGYSMIKLYGIGLWDDEFECWKIDAHHKMKADVLAWMPLPPRYAPYQKGE